MEEIVAGWLSGRMVQLGWFRFHVRYINVLAKSPSFMGNDNPVDIPVTDVLATHRKLKQLSIYSPLNVTFLHCNSSKRKWGMLGKWWKRCCSSDCITVISNPIPLMSCHDWATWTNHGSQTPPFPVDHVWHRAVASVSWMCKVASRHLSVGDCPHCTCIEKHFKCVKIV